MKISVSGFGKLFFKLRKEHGQAVGIELDVPKGCNIFELISFLSLVPEDIEGVFVNGRIRSFDYILKDGDRVGLVPPGTPGPYRVLLGITRFKNPI